MSIVCVLAQASPPEVPIMLGLIFLAVMIAMTVLSPWLFYRLRMHRTPPGGGPVRFGPADALWKFLLLLAASFIFMVTAGQLLVPLMGGLPLAEQALVASMLGTFVAFFALIPLNSALRPDGVRLLGMEPKGVVPGFVAGGTWFLIAFPWIFWLMLIGTALLQRFMPEAPREHDLFRLWQRPETTAFFRSVALFTAVIVAPLFEELVFRGFLQTGIARLFTSKRHPVIHPPAPFQAPPPAPLSPPPLPQGGAVLNYAPAGVRPVLDYATAISRTPLPNARWAAIIITSILFAAIHRPWTIVPPIFLLSLALGYVYERTGNLWSAIWLHLFFNGFQFALFLLIVSR